MPPLAGRTHIRSSHTSPLEAVLKPRHGLPARRGEGGEGRRTLTRRAEADSAAESNPARCRADVRHMRHVVPSAVAPWLAPACQPPRAYVRGRESGDLVGSHGRWNGPCIHVLPSEMCAQGGRGKQQRSFGEGVRSRMRAGRAMGTHPLLFGGGGVQLHRVRTVRGPLHERLRPKP
jgi:hypothetical protein